jgi:hypothetical protein
LAVNNRAYAAPGTVGLTGTRRLRPLTEKETTAYSKTKQVRPASGPKLCAVNAPGRLVHCPIVACSTIQVPSKLRSEHKEL